MANFRGSLQGKQQGENIAVKKSPAVPNLSMLSLSLIAIFL
jgi:hypothetical protein